MSEPTLKKYNIGYAMREYAREMGDPILATVEATSKEEAEKKAWEQGIRCNGAGLWAWEAKE